MNDLPPLYILGSSGLARVIAHHAHAAAPLRRILFVDDRSQAEDCITVDQYYKYLARDGGESIMGAGRCEVRQRMLLEIRPPFATLIHPSAVVMGVVGPGCLVYPGAMIDPGANLDSHVLVNKNAIIGHDASIGSLSVIGPLSMIGGWCHLHEAVYVGAGALIRERLLIGSNAVIGMGAVVTRDVPANQVAKGNPARTTQKSQRSGGWL